MILKEVSSKENHIIDHRRQRRPMPWNRSLPTGKTSSSLPKLLPMALLTRKRPLRPFRRRKPTPFTKEPIPNLWSLTTPSLTGSQRLLRPPSNMTPDRSDQGMWERSWGANHQQLLLVRIASSMASLPSSPLSTTSLPSLNSHLKMYRRIRKMNIIFNI